MGIWDSFLSLLNLNKKRANIMIVGLDNAGKSSVVRYLQSGRSSQVIVPTIGYQVETIKSESVTLPSYLLCYHTLTINELLSRDTQMAD